MGYDMYIEEPDEDLRPEHQRLHEILYGNDGLYARRNKGEAGVELVIETTRRSYDELDNHFYFRLNISGMVQCRKLMAQRGMIFEGTERPWPLREEFPTDEDYKRACDAHRDAADGDQPGIPVHKLSSNDGWLVTPIECMGALKVWDSLGEKDLPTLGREPVVWWPEWLEFLEEAAEHGGFRVW